MLARAAFVVVAIIVALGLLRGQPFIEMLIIGIALAVAVVPEALACCRHHLAGDWCAKDGQTQRPHAPSARCRDAWQHFSDLLRQNRHAHQR